MKINSILLFIILMFLLAACQPFRYLTIDLSDRAKEELPSGIQSLTLINRAVDKRFTNDPADSIQLRFYESQFNLDTVIYDVQAADTLLKALGNLLYESGRYDVVIPENRFLMKDSLNLYSSEMDWKTAEELTNLFRTDAILSLDFYKTTINAAFGSKKVMDQATLDYFPYYLAGLDVNYAANFRLYYPVKKDLLISYFLADTLQWVGSEFDIKKLFKGMTSVKNALSETAVAAALNLSGRIAPTWNSYRRAFFTSGNRSFKQTQSLVFSNKWGDALSAWMEMLEKTRSKSLQSKMEFNIALAYEMKGELDEALRWGVRSYNTYYRPVTYNYLKILQQRKSQFNKSDGSNP
jgi:hypothetical protein